MSVAAVAIQKEKGWDETKKGYMLVNFNMNVQMNVLVNFNMNNIFLFL